MALATSRRNGMAMILLVVSYIALSRVSELWADVYRNIPWNLSLSLLAVQLFVFGAASFFAFGGGFWIRASLATTVPVLSHAILELIWGSDPAYPYLTLVRGAFLLWCRFCRRSVHGLAGLTEPLIEPSNSALLTDAYTSPLRAQRGAAKRGR